ncbi:MAG: serine/threonine protein phosphatase [Spirochaetales bacterium]|nr:serine/threonine protein phosphatase [Spirochaetales bacterium]
MKKRTIFIGDVHGCLDELRALLKKCNLSADDRVILTGDLINRGPDSRGVVDLVREKGYECVRGNHEDYFLRGVPFEERNHSYATLGDEQRNFIENLPLYLHIDSFLVVHAGLMPGVPVEKTPARILLHIRTWDGTGKILNHSSHPAWHESYSGPPVVIYGHWARQGLHRGPYSIGLDSGCVYGRQLSAYIAEEDRIVQVEARRAYYRPDRG